MPKPIITITRVSRRLGVSTRTIRAYEEEGFITLIRTGGRCFLLPDDVEVVALAERLKADLGVNLAGVGVVLEMRRKIVEMQDRMADMEREFDRRLRQALEDQRRQMERPVIPRTGGALVEIITDDD